MVNIRNRPNPAGARSRILSAATNLFEERGYHETSVQEVVDAAGVTKGAFYYYFSSKDDLLLELHHQLIGHSLRRAEEILAVEASPSEHLKGLMVSILQAMDVYRAHVTTFMRDWRFLEREKFEEVLAQRRQLEGAFVSVIERGLASGEFACDLPPKIASFGIIGMCAWAHQWYEIGGNLSAEEIGDGFADMVLDGLKCRRMVASFPD